MENDKEMYYKYVELAWCPADIKAIRPTWSDEKCKEALLRVSGWFTDRSIESGWEILENLIDIEYDEDEEED